MLRAMRSASKTWVMKIILGFLALTFVAFFGGGFVGGGGGHGGGHGGANPNAVVQVGDIAIDARTISTAVNREVQNFSQVIGQPVNLEQAFQFGLINRAVSTVITDALFELGVTDLGVAVPDDQIVGFIRSQPNFQNENGFDAGTYDAFLLHNGISEGQFIADLRQQLNRGQLLGTIGAASSTPFTLVDTVNNYRNETRVLEGVVIGAIDIDEVFIPTEADLAAFYEEAKNDFLTPEYRRVTIASLTPQDYARNVTVTEADIEREFNARAAEFIIPEQRELSQIVFSSQADAQSAADAISGGADFATVSEDATGGPPISLGQMTVGDLFPELVDAAFSIAEGATSAPVESPLGWHIIRADAVYEGENPSIDDIRDELTESAAVLIARDEIFGVMDAVEDSLAQGDTLVQAAQANGLTLVETVIAADGTAPDGTTVEGFGHGNEALAAAFATAVGDEPQLREDATGGFFSATVQEVIAPEPRPLEDIRDDLTFAWEDAQIRAAAQAKAQQITDAVAGGLPFADAVADHNIPLAVTEPTTRNGENAGDLPVELVAEAFGAQTGDIVSVELSDSVAIARVADVIAPSGAGTLIDLQSSMTQAMAQDLQLQLAEALRQDFTVDIDQDAIEQLFTP